MRIVAAEIDRLAHFINAILQRLAGFARHQGNQAVRVRLQSISHGAQVLGARAAADLVPARLRLHSARKCAINLTGISFGHCAQHA